MLRMYRWHMLALSLSASCVSAQDFPNHTVRIVTSSPGSTTDIVARLIAQGLPATLGQQVIVDNRGDSVSQEIVAKAPPDGYTLLVTGSGFWVDPLLQKLPYDPVKDFSPITLATTAPNILVASPSLPVKSVKDLIALAKASPGKLNCGSACTGGSAHLAGELFKSMAGVDIVHVPYKGASAALTALIGNEVQMMFATAGSADPHLKSGKLNALAVTSLQPSLLVPNVPTIAASGLPGYDATSVVSVFAPAKMSTTLVTRLNREIVALINKSENKQRLFTSGVEAVGSTPSELSSRRDAEMARLGKVIKDAGIAVQ